jgi:hypothetical protein
MDGVFLFGLLALIYGALNPTGFETITTVLGVGGGVLWVLVKIYNVVSPSPTDDKS